MVKFAIPSGRVHEWSEVAGGTTNLPAQPRLVGSETAFLVGGADKTSEIKKYFVAVGTSGLPLQFKARKNIFQASSPSDAAKKFFNSWWKSTEQGPCSSAPKTATFEDAFANINAEQLEKKMLVRIAEVGASKMVRNYIVNYVPNPRPNLMERQQRIVCKSRAIPLSAGEKRPDNTIDLESYASL